MSELILKGDGSPFATREAAKSKRTRMGSDGLDTNIVAVDGGFALEKIPYKKPKKRIPLGQRSVLTVPKEDKDPNYEYRFVNDRDGRIRMFRDAGWEVVKRRERLEVGDPQVGVGNQPGSIVSKSVGKGTVSYLMRIPKEFYREDQETKAEKINETEAGLKMEDKKEGRYGKVKIDQKKT